MSGWTFFFILVGVVFLTSQLFRVIDAIERPNRRHDRRRTCCAAAFSPACRTGKCTCTGWW